MLGWTTKARLCSVSFGVNVAASLGCTLEVKPPPLSLSWSVRIRGQPFASFRLGYETVQMTRAKSPRRKGSFCFLDLCSASFARLIKGYFRHAAKSHPQFPVEGAVLDRFADVFDGDFLDGGEVGDGAGDFDDPVVSPCAEVQRFHGHF